MTEPPPEWHRLLLRQLRRAALDPAQAAADPVLGPLLTAVSATYDDADQYRYLNDRAFELSSSELVELNDLLRAASETELAREHARLEAVFDAVAVGLVVVDANAWVLDLNGTARDLLARADQAGTAPLDGVLHPATNEASDDRTYSSLIRAIRRGTPWRGDDVLIRGADDRAFPASISFSPLIEDGTPSGGVLAVADVSERHSAAEELAYRATHDSLTGLLNREALMDYVESALRPSGDPPTPAAPIGVLFIDLDRFKMVNDTLGHAAGDDLLRIVVDRIRAVLRDGDTLARLGGDEFVILCEDADAAAAMRVAERVTRAVAQPVGLGHETAFVSASIGVTISGPDSTAASLLRDADVAVYRAKADGRARSVLFSDSMRAEVAERFRMERALRQSLDHAELSVVYQPVLSLADDALTGFEALVRWQQDGRTVSPDTFVRLAEDTGLIGLLGEFVLTTAVDFLSSLAELGAARLSVSVNVSPVQFGDPGLLEHVTRLVRTLPGREDLLVLEVTETALLGDPDSARAYLEALHGLGVRVVLDDFGTGYSSLSTLRDFPLDGFKVDRAFVRDLTTNVRDRAIVSAMADLGHALGMVIVAEGAETPDDVEAVRRLGCDRVQGFALSRPLPPGAAVDLVRRHLSPDRAGAVGG